MQNACAILSLVACLTLQYFSTFSVNSTILGGKKVTEHKMCFGFLYELSEKNYHSKKNAVRCYHICTAVFL
jgi:hypothetical protein